MEQTTCEVADSVQAYKCQREEQCDDCFMIDHLKECEWCEHYDHPVRKLQVQHQSSDFPSDVPSYTVMNKTGCDLLYGAMLFFYENNKERVEQCSRNVTHLEISIVIPPVMRF